ncbi:MAG: flippase-like domain-containing protein, partial [Planctomycetaceae bacterium]|nr:flippase-like domain-containing protein [Planctomycetaceae bacterium]
MSKKRLNMTSSNYKTLLFAIKLILILLIFTFLFWQAARNNAFSELFRQQPRWEMIAAAFLCQCISVSITIIRWRKLAHTLGLMLSLKDAFRYGFLGLALSLAPMGIFGGDAMKTYLLMRRNPEKRSSALASVLVDRVVGLLAMFICATIFICATGFVWKESLLAKSVCNIVFLFTIIGFFGCSVMFLPIFSSVDIERWTLSIPIFGRYAIKLVHPLLIYRNNLPSVLTCFLLSAPVHLSFGLSLWFLASGIFTSIDVPNLPEHIMLYSAVNITSMIPLAAGPFEFVLEQIYPLFGVRIGVGMVVAIAFRIVAILVAAIGIIFYFTLRAEIHEVQEKLNS